MIAVAIYAFGGIRTVGVLLGSQHAAFEAEIVPASQALALMRGVACCPCLADAFTLNDLVIVELGGAKPLG